VRMSRKRRDRGWLGLERDLDGAKLVGRGLQDPQPRVGHGQERAAAQLAEGYQSGIGQYRFHRGAVATTHDRVELGGIGQQDAGGRTCGIRESGSGLVGPAPGEALLRPPASPGGSLDVPGADFGSDEIGAGEHTDRMTAPAHKQHADGPAPRRVGDQNGAWLLTGRDRRQRRKRHHEPRAGAIGAGEPNLGRISLAHRRAVTFSETVQPSGQPFHRDTHPAHTVQFTTTSRGRLNGVGWRHWAAA
jgi:hypothetical protein